MITRQNPVVYLFRMMWRHAEGNRKKIILYVFLFGFANVTSLAEPLVVAKILNIVQEQGVSRQNLHQLLLLLSFFMGMTLLFWVFHGPARIIEQSNAFLVRARYKMYLMDGVLALPPQWHTDHHSGDTIDKIEKGTRDLYEFSSNTFEIIETIVRLVGAYIALIIFHLHSSYIVAFTVVVTLWIIFSFDKILERQYRQLNHAENAIAAKIFDIISNITTVIILSVEKLVSTDIMRAIWRPRVLVRRNLVINETKWFLVSVFGSLTLVLVIASYIVVHVRSGLPVLIGSIYLLYGYVDKIQNQFFRVAYLYGDIVRRKAHVMNAEEVASAFQKKSRIIQIVFPRHWRTIELQRVSFAYPDQNHHRLQLDDISLTMHRGEKIAVVGASGSGKTTFLKVMRNLYHPQKGKILLDGRMVPNGFAAMSSAIALIPQDPEIFTATIKENITMGVAHTMQTIRTFSDRARFTSVAEQLPKKFLSSIVEKGVNLSGGEKQRLALARGLMVTGDKQILLLDEPTSSVDAATELVIFKNIFQHYRGKTVIASVHRLHLLPMFDTIVLFADGKIIASGSFAVLKNSNPIFQKLWRQYHSVHKQSTTKDS